MTAVVVYSGGMDSTVLLYYLREQLKGTKGVWALSFHYGQRHARELDHAGRITAMLDLPHEVVELGDAVKLMASGALTGGADVPEGHYEDESMKQTVVPNRNMVMLSLATSFAITNGLSAVAYAAHAGDHAIYPDCRRAFVDAMVHAIGNCDWSSVDLFTPFIDMTKDQIVKIGRQLDVPFELTWSCYKGGDLHCGKCGTCVERREAFQRAAVEDPTEYAS